MSFLTKMKYLAKENFRSVEQESSSILELETILRAAIENGEPIDNKLRFFKLILNKPFDTFGIYETYEKPDQS